MSEPSSPGRRSLTARLLTWYAIVFLAVMAVFSLTVNLVFRSVLERQVISDLEDTARLVGVWLSSEGSSEPAGYADAAGARITIIGRDGAVIADSHFDPAQMENHGDRPEVRAAFAGGVGTDRRVSATLDEPRLYVAVPLDGEDRVVRLSVTEEELEEDLAEVGARLRWLPVPFGLVGLVAVFWVARRITRPIRELTDAADDLASGRLDIRPHRSSVAEIDRLGLAIGDMASELGQRIVLADEERTILEDVLGALPHGILLIGSWGSVIYANEAAEAMLGAIPERAAALVPRGINRLVRDAGDTAAPVAVEVDHGTPSRCLHAVATPFEESDRVLLFIQDVTERLRLEAARRDFVADASHELKTPVAAIMASTEALELALAREPAKAAEFAGRVESSARQLTRIVGDLLDLSRLEVSEPEMVPVGLHELVRSEVEAIRGRAAEARVDLSCEVEEVVVPGSAADLRLAIRNLCDNAVRYTDSGGSIRVELHRAGDWARLSVSDTGTGIPTRALGRVFERFYRVDEARSRATGGTGLGLAIVKHVSERHGGSVSVESELGVGSMFTVELPVALEDALRSNAHLEV